MPSTPSVPRLSRTAIGLLVATLAVGMVGPAAADPRPAGSGVEVASVAAPDLTAAQRDLRDEVVARADGEVTVRRHRDTGQVRFLGADAGTLGRPDGVAADAPPATAARAFLDRSGGLFGLADARAELSVVRTDDATAAGRRAATVRLRQVHDGVPVVGGELAVQLTDTNEVLSTTGEFLPDLDVDVTPTVTADDAVDTARAAVAKAEARAAADLVASTPELVVLDRTLLESRPDPLGPRLAWQVEVTADGVRRDAWVDADLPGRVLLVVDGIHGARRRLVCDDQNNSSRDYDCFQGGPSPIVRREGQGASGIADVDLAYTHSGQVYDYFAGRFGRDGVDDGGHDVVSTVRECPPPSIGGCPQHNAFWDGYQMVFGAGWATDDVVGHEFTHGVVEATSGLFYHAQSGAINEALADAFGEFVDLGNGQGADGAARRWEVGEDTPIGAIRDMSDPTAYGHPDRMSSPWWYVGTGTGPLSQDDDSDGVHVNSGVLNRFTSLLVDGGTFNGRTVTAQGLQRVPRVLYEAATGLLTSGSDYADLASALRQACRNVIGVDGVTSGTCTNVDRAVLAVEMDQAPNGATTTAPVCPAGQVATDLFADDLEADEDAWIATEGFASVFGYAHSGDWALYLPNPGQVTDEHVRMATAVTVPAGASAFLRFDHAFEFDHSFPPAGEGRDGGIVEYSANGGAWTDLLPGRVTHGGYTGTVTSGRGNPLAGRSAFVDVSHGWQSTRVDLSGLAGSNVRVRFRVGTDDENHDLGWLVDDVRVVTCAAARGLRFVPLEPCAVFDTRSATDSRGGPADGGDVLAFRITGASLPTTQGAEDCTPPPATAAAVELNLIATGPRANGNLRVSAAGVEPSGGVVNFSAGSTNSSSVPVEVDPQGRVEVGVNSGSDRATHVRGVAVGYWVEPADGGLLTVPIEACAVFDTRRSGGAMDDDERRTWRVAGTFDPTTQGGEECTPPPAGAVAAMVNLVAINPASSGNLQAVAAGGVANGGVVNITGGGGTNANAVPLALSADGRLDVTAQFGDPEGSVHVRGVVLAWLAPPGTAASVGGLELVPTTACAVFDTRFGRGSWGRRAAHGDRLTVRGTDPVALPRTQGAELCAPPPDQATALMLNLVAVGPSADGNLRLGPQGSTPAGGVVNFSTARGTNSNAVVTGLADRRADVLTGANGSPAVHVRGVALGWFRSPD